jgi:cytidylate kinase
MQTRQQRKPIVICISGLAGSGKSTVARKLAQKYKLKYYSGGEALKALAAEEGYKPTEQGFWESKEGMKFLDQRSKDPKLDEQVDRRLLKSAEEGNVILDSWTMPWLLKEGFKIWLDASVEKRAERVSHRDGITVKETLQALRMKEAGTRSIYRKLYKFKLGEDFAPFHLILDTNPLTADEVFTSLSNVIENMILRTDETDCCVRKNK